MTETFIIFLFLVFFILRDNWKQKKKERGGEDANTSIDRDTGVGEVFDGSKDDLLESEE